MPSSSIKINKNNTLFYCIDKFIFINTFKHENIVVMVIIRDIILFHISLNKETIN